MSNLSRRNLLLGIARMKGVRIADLAHQFGTHRSVIYKIISGHLQSPRTASALYRKLGVTRKMLRRKR